jgi:hypothetical protein
MRRKDAGIVTSTWGSHATAILIIIEGQLQGFQRFSGSKLVLRTVESCFEALNYYEKWQYVIVVMIPRGHAFQKEAVPHLLSAHTKLV